MSLFTQLSRAFLDAVFPPDPNEVPLSEVNVEMVREHFRFVCVDRTHARFACSEYQDPLIHSLIRQLKFKRKRAAAELLAILPHVALSSDRAFASDRTRLIVPLPGSSSRVHERGYDQCTLLARALCTHDPSLQFEPIIVRARNAPSQTGLDRAERLSNQRGAFAVRMRRTTPSLASATLILLDDVTTTGATLTEARTTLLKAGAQDVRCLAIAH